MSLAMQSAHARGRAAGAQRLAQIRASTQTFGSRSLRAPEPLGSTAPSTAVAEGARLDHYSLVELAGICGLPAEQIRLRFVLMRWKAGLQYEKWEVGIFVRRWALPSLVAELATSGDAPAAARLLTHLSRRIDSVIPPDGEYVCPPRCDQSAESVMPWYRRGAMA
jgi:hypothetical protein